MDKQAPARDKLCAAIRGSERPDSMLLALLRERYLLSGHVLRVGP